MIDTHNQCIIVSDLIRILQSNTALSEEQVGDILESIDILKSRQLALQLSRLSLENEELVPECRR